MGYINGPITRDAAFIKTFTDQDAGTCSGKDGKSYKKVTLTGKTPTGVFCLWLEQGAVEDLTGSEKPDVMCTGPEVSVRITDSIGSTKSDPITTLASIGNGEFFRVTGDDKVYRKITCATEAPTVANSWVIQITATAAVEMLDTTAVQSLGGANNHEWNL